MARTQHCWSMGGHISMGDPDIPRCETEYGREDNLRRRTTSAVAMDGPGGGPLIWGTICSPFSRYALLATCHNNWTEDSNRDRPRTIEIGRWEVPKSTEVRLRRDRKVSMIASQLYHVRQVNFSLHVTNSSHCTHQGPMAVKVKKSSTNVHHFCKKKHKIMYIIFVPSFSERKKTWTIIPNFLQNKA